MVWGEAHQARNHWSQQFHTKMATLDRCARSCGVFCLAGCFPRVDIKMSPTQTHSTQLKRSRKMINRFFPFFASSVNLAKQKRALNTELLSFFLCTGASSTELGINLWSEDGWSDEKWADFIQEDTHGVLMSFCEHCPQRQLVFKSNSLLIWHAGNHKLRSSWQILWHLLLFGKIWFSFPFFLSPVCPYGFV